MSKLSWYWHRLRAMSLAEMALHARKKTRAWSDARRHSDWATASLTTTGHFPVLPEPADAPQVVRTALRRDAENILAGRWKAFGQVALQVDDPPHWHRDYLVGQEVPGTEVAFRLDHRALPPGTDVKLIWELSRWYQLVRLAQAAYVLDDELARRAAEKCAAWLEDWVRHNPPFRGWNWTSTLEVGIRLIQFTWLDALLAAAPAFASRRETLRQQILPPHVWYAWRHQSFGSSANNHLLGELVGLILATRRWPALSRWSASLDELQRRWEQEIRAQFALDGGNREQALNYQLFSWEFGWQARAALVVAGRVIAPDVDERLRRAAQFFVDVQVPAEPWDYGDSDNAFVSPTFADETRVVAEWHQWFREPEKTPALEYWWGSSRRDFLKCCDASPLCSPASFSAATSPTDVTAGDPAASPADGWTYFPDTGHSVVRQNGWILRLDLSPLGYLRTAAHGHLDALHLAIWLDDVAMVIDPGTGAYYADQPLRKWLASRTAHNSPCPTGSEWPKRLGPFLWAEHHHPPTVEGLTSSGRLALSGAGGRLQLDQCVISRKVMWQEQSQSWQVEDQTLGRGNSTSPPGFSTRWQFAPGAKLERLADRRFLVIRRGAALRIEVSEGWTDVLAASHQDEAHALAVTGDETEARFAGVVSPGFRQVTWAPFLKLVAPAGAVPTTGFTTTFSRAL